MASALLAARLIRRAITASSSSPLTTLARCWPRSSAPSATAVLPPRGLAADASSTSVITARRCLASHSAASSPKISEKLDQNLLQLIDEEIRCADRISERYVGDPPEEFPFEVVSNCGDYSVALEREFTGDIIKAMVEIDHFTKEEPIVGEYFDGEYEEVLVPKIDQMVITVEKPEGSIIKFHCKFFYDREAFGETDDEFVIKMVVQKVRLLNCGDCDSEYVYKRRKLYSAEDDESQEAEDYEWREAEDDELQKALRGYLEVRGIKEQWVHWIWLYEYVASLGDNDLLWWQNLKAFIAK